MKTQPEIARRATFASIRYSQCWEDADIMLEALRPRKNDTLLSIASAGDNVLALVASGARRVIAVDLSAAQIACLDLRVAAYSNLRHRELLELLGVEPSTRRAELYRRCRAALTAPSRSFWDAHGALIAEGFARCGKFERYLATFRRFVLPLVQSEKQIRQLFELETEVERRAFYDRCWNTPRVHLLCRLFFSRSVLGRLGRDPSFMRYADEPVWRGLQRRLPHALITQDPAANPYLQWILLGRFVASYPYALRAENFDRIRSNLTSLEWHCGSLEGLLEGVADGSLNGCNLSDVFEYMSETDAAALQRELVRCAAPGSRFVYWNLVVERRCGPTLSGAVTGKRELALSLHRRDKVFFYRDLILEEVV